MPRKFHKHKLLLDEGIPPRTRFPILNHRFDIKHIVTDLHKSGTSDLDVYKLAVIQKRLVITYNIKDFIAFVNKSKQSGIIGISPNLTSDQIDKKLTALLLKSNPSKLFGKFHFVGGETKA